MLYANMASLSASIFVTWITVYLLGSVDLAVLSILGLYALKSFLTAVSYTHLDVYKRQIL